MMHRMLRFASLVLAATAIGAPAAYAQVTKQGNAYLFRMKFTPGQTVRYSMDTKMSGGGPQAGGGGSLTSPMILKTTSVKKGVATVQATIGPMKMNGNPMGAAQTATVTIDSRGQTTGAAASRMQGIGTVLPAQPIKVGGTWTANMNTQGMQMKSIYKLTGFKNSPAGQLAVLAVTITGTGAAKLSGTGTTTLLMRDGSLYSSVANLSLGQAGQPGMKMAVTVKRST